MTMLIASRDKQAVSREVAHYNPAFSDTLVGEYDGVALAELPDDTTATAIALAAVSPGHLKAYKTTKLFTVEETMEAMRKAGNLVFQGPS